MRVVVVGASGNVGTAVLRRLLRTPGVDRVTGVARRPPAGDAGAPYDSVDWLRCDIGGVTAPDVLTRTFTGADVVIHLAWQIQPTHDRRQLYRTNVVGSRHVLDALQRAGVPALVHASSVGAYAPGPKDRRVSEDWPVTGVPGSTYSADKAEVEAMLDRADPGLRVVRLRPGLIFQRSAGASIARYFLGPWAPVSLLRAQRLPLVPRHDLLRVQCVHADDVADAYVRAAVGDVRGAFNIATEPVLDGDLAAAMLRGRAVTVPERALLVGADLTWRARLQPVDAGWVRLGLAAPLLDSTRARTELDWTPRWDAEAALRDLLTGLSRGEGRATAVLRPRPSVPTRILNTLTGRLPGHGERY